jgi:hypothetical protein
MNTYLPNVSSKTVSLKLGYEVYLVLLLHKLVSRDVLALIVAMKMPVGIELVSFILSLDKLVCM